MENESPLFINNQDENNPKSLQPLNIKPGTDPDLLVDVIKSLLNNNALLHKHINLLEREHKLYRRDGL
jgi:hypothetical protein